MNKTIVSQCKLLKCHFNKRNVCLRGGITIGEGGRCVNYRDKMDSDNNDEPNLWTLKFKNDEPNLLTLKVKK